VAKKFKQAVDQIDFERCRRDPHYFIFEQVRTKDEHDAADPVKRFPDHLYLRSLLDCLLVAGRLLDPGDARYAIEVGHSEAWLAALRTSGILPVEKSRQVMATWLCSAYLLWRAKFRDHQLILIQSKKEEDAANLVFNGEAWVARMSFMEVNLPQHLRSIAPKAGMSYAQMRTESGSRLWGIPEGGDIIRSNTASVLFSDEAAFQPEFGNAFTAALPAMKGGGSMASISSAESGSFAELIEAGESCQATKYPGISERITKSGLPVLRLHYSADPDKRPGTPVGDAWLAQATQGYPGGTRSPRWMKEMEIDFGALGGTKLIPGWDELKANGRIVIPPITPIGFKLYGSYDHGWRHKATYLVHGINSDGKKFTLWEFWASHVSYQYIARIIKGETVRVPPPGCSCHPNVRTFPGNPYAGQEAYKVADRSLWADDEPQNDGTMKSMAKLFAREGVFFQKAEAGGDTTFAEWLTGFYWRDPLNPLYCITTACPGLIWEIGQQRHKDVSDKVALNKHQPEELVDKDNDAWDACKYWHLKFPPRPMQSEAAQKPNSFQWWREQSKRASAGEPTATFSMQREMIGG